MTKKYLSTQMLYPLLIPVWFRKLFPDILWQGKAEGKKVYLTFDDGPIPEATPWVLDLLKQYNQKATFFCVGENVARHPDIYETILTQGHAVGNHTQKHVNGWKTNTKEYLEDVDKAGKLIKSDLFRPPYGKLTLYQYLYIKKEKKIVMWTILSGDFDPNFDRLKCLSLVKKYSKDGAILVFHDSIKAQKNLHSVLPLILEYYRNEGIQSFPLTNQS